MKITSGEILLSGTSGNHRQEEILISSTAGCGFKTKNIFSLYLQVSVLKIPKYVLLLKIKIDIKAKHLLHKL